MISNVTPYIHTGLSSSQQICVLGDSSVTQIRQGLRSGLVVWWKFDEGTGSTASDASGNNHTGTLENGAVWVPGRLGGFAINTSSGLADVTDSPITTGAAHTISAWTQFPISASGNHTLALNSAGGSLGDVHLLFAAGKLGIFLQSNGSGFHGSGILTSSISAGWHLVTAVAAGGNTDFYIDGTKAGTANAQATDPIDLVGNNTQSQPWGIFDDFRVWNRALSALENSNLYRFGT